MSSNNLPHNAPQGQVPITQTRAMSPARALTLAALAIEYHTTGHPALDTFGSDEVWATWSALLEQEKKYQQGPERKAILTAQQAVKGVYYHLKAYRLTRIVSAKRRQEAAPIIARLLEQAEREEDAYWAEFAAAVLEEALAVIDEAVQL